MAKSRPTRETVLVKTSSKSTQHIRRKTILLFISFPPTPTPRPSLLTVNFIKTKMGWGWGFEMEDEGDWAFGLHSKYIVYETKFCRSLLPQITEACVHVTGNAVFHMTWHLNKVDTYYKNRKRPFYWNNWSPIDATYRLKETGRLHFCSLVFRCVLCWGLCLCLRFCLICHKNTTNVISVPNTSPNHK